MVVKQCSTICDCHLAIFNLIHRYGMGQIYLRQEKYKQAEQHFAKALQLHPGSSVLRCYMASAQAKQGKTGEALSHLEVGGVVGLSRSCCGPPLVGVCMCCWALPMLCHLAGGDPHRP